MAKHILINVVPWEARVALLEDTTLVELHIERGRQRGIAGNVYKGKVVRVLPGMQAAFVDIGLEKAAFLHVSDMPGEEELPATLTQEGDVEAADVAPVVARDARPIEERLQKGQEVLVQVAKEPMGTKGARVTSHVSLPGRYLVCMPGTRHIGISRRIEDAAERERLRGIVEAEGTPDAGFIVRTACEGVTKREIHDDVRFLTRLWARVEKTAAAATAPALIHQDLDLVLRVVRDLFTSDVERLSVDAPEDYERVLEFVKGLMPRLASRVHLYEGVTPLFEQHGVETKIARALERRVWLKSGGYLIFDQTESLTTVDVNSGRYVGKKSQEETILRVNLEAAKQVVQQLRLRNIGGIISELGLVQMTRKRTRESLEQLLTSPCAHCGGTGRVRSVETIAYDALRRAFRESAAHANSARIALRVHPDVAVFLTERERQSLEALERQSGRTVAVEPVPELGRDEVDVRVGS